MVDGGAISAALASLVAAKDIGKAMIGIRDAAAFNAKLIEFQSKILEANEAAFAAQQERSSLLEEIGKLEAQVAGFEAWEAEKKRYELQDFGGGTFAYVLKADMANGEAIHRLCANCYQKNEKSILQCRGNNGSAQQMCSCPNCGTNYRFGAPQQKQIGALATRRGTRRF